MDCSRTVGWDVRGPGTAAGVAVAGLVLLAFGPQSGHARIVTPENGVHQGGCYSNCEPCPCASGPGSPCFGYNCGSCCGGLSGYSCDISDDDGVLQSCYETVPGSGSDTLSLKGNPIRGIRPGAFAGLSRLRMLVIIQNPELRTIVNGTFAGLYGLIYLFLNNNALRKIEPGTFRESRLGGYYPRNSSEDRDGYLRTQLELQSNPLTVFPCEGLQRYTSGGLAVTVQFPVGFNFSTDCCSACTFSPTMSPTTPPPTRPPTTSPTRPPTTSAPTLVPTASPTESPTLHQRLRLHLAPLGSRQCDSGSVASQQQCEAAVETFAAAAGATPARSMQTGSGGSCLDGAWGRVPLGCSAQSGGDWTAHYKTSGVTEAGCIDQDYQLVCSGAGTLHPSPTSSEVPFPIAIVASIAGGVVILAGVLWMVVRKKGSSPLAQPQFNNPVANDIDQFDVPMQSYPPPEQQQQCQQQQHPTVYE